jgi:hypothetical protein
MAKAFYIFIFLVFVIPTSTVLACSSESKEVVSEQGTCETKSDKETKSCCSRHTENDCKGGCNNTDCNCPVVVNLPMLVGDFAVRLTPNFKLIKLNWAYVQNAPKPVYLSIWQPPKISLIYNLQA